jgi:hypothetical protein
VLFSRPPEPPDPSAPGPATGIPPEPDLNEMEEARRLLATGLLELREYLAPAFDAGDGIRADLVARGWSPQMAEMLAGTWLHSVITNLTPLSGGPQ